MPVVQGRVGVPLTADASGSWDPDDRALTFGWTLSLQPAGGNAALSATTTATPTFTPDVEGTYVLDVLVTASDRWTDAASVTVLAATDDEDATFVRLWSDPGDQSGGAGLRLHPGRRGDLGGRDRRPPLQSGSRATRAGSRTSRCRAASHVEPGTYAGLQRYPTHDPAMRWHGLVRTGRGCGALTGSFTVDSVAYDGDQLVALDLRFEQRCQYATAALRGQLHYVAGDTTPAAGAGAATSRPDSGSRRPGARRPAGTTSTSRVSRGKGSAAAAL